MESKIKTKSSCGKCGRELIHEKEIFSCIHGCTFCYECSKELNYICPNCMGDLYKKVKSQQ